MFGNEQREQKKQFAESLAMQSESNDNDVMRTISDPSKIAYDPQVSAMLIEMQRKFLKWELKQQKDIDGRIVTYLVCTERYPYKEPYGDEALAFMNELEERGLLNQFGDSLSLVKMFADKYDLDWSLPFNQVVTVRENFLVNSRTTGKGSKLAKSQITDSTASISRRLETPKKKAWWDIFG